jgi:hypothetical protein
MYELLTLFGSNVVEEVIEIATCCDLQVAYDTYKSMGMDNHAECIEYLFYEG